MSKKIVITGEIEVKTGLHIGTGGEFAAIGAVDSPVVKDQISGEPIIPGSSLKGKIRTLLAQNIHPAENASKDCELIKRMFGSACDSKNPKALISRFSFSDCYMTNSAEIRNMDINLTEVKFENGINRFIGKAMPRQIERVIRGAKFGMEIVYTVENAAEVKEDFETFAKGLKLLEFDYLGGGGTRGNGRVKFNNLKVSDPFGDSKDIENMAGSILQGI